jgi:DNA-binding MarR family transcriptional regulator
VKRATQVDVHAFIGGLERFKSIKPDMQIATALTLLYIGRRGVCVQQDIEQELRLSNAAASRNINYWTKSGNKGLDFIERYEDPSDRRNNMLRLSKSGQEFYNQLTGRSSHGSTARKEMAS